MFALYFRKNITNKLKQTMSSSESDEEDWMFYRDREEWNDVTPIPQDDGPFPVAQIAYSDKCKFIY